MVYKIETVHQVKRPEFDEEMNKNHHIGKILVDKTCTIVDSFYS